MSKYEQFAVYVVFYGLEINILTPWLPVKFCLFLTLIIIGNEGSSYEEEAINDFLFKGFPQRGCSARLNVHGASFEFLH